MHDVVGQAALLRDPSHLLFRCKVPRASIRVAEPVLRPDVTLVADNTVWLARVKRCAPDDDASERAAAFTDRVGIRQGLQHF